MGILLIVACRCFTAGHSCKRIIDTGRSRYQYLADKRGLEQAQVHRLGIPDVFSEQATRDEQLAAHDLDADGLVRAAKRFLGARIVSAAK